LVSAVRVPSSVGRVPVKPLLGRSLHPHVAATLSPPPGDGARVQARVGEHRRRRWVRLSATREIAVRGTCQEPPSSRQRTNDGVGAPPSTVRCPNARGHTRARSAALGRHACDRGGHACEGLYIGLGNSQLSATSGPSEHRAEESKCYIKRMSN
jgi:hypothetical protein